MSQTGRTIRIEPVRSNGYRVPARNYASKSARDFVASSPSVLILSSVVAWIADALVTSVLAGCGLLSMTLFRKRFLLTTP